MANETGKHEDWPLATSENPLGYSLTCVLEPSGDGYTAYIAELRGVVSEGKNQREAIENVVEACRLAIEVYKEKGLAIPWEVPLPPGQLRVGVTVPG